MSSELLKFKYLRKCVYRNFALLCSATAPWKPCWRGAQIALKGNCWTGRARLPWKIIEISNGSRSEI